MARYTIDDDHPPILTAKVGDNSDQFPDVLALYVPPPALILDMTYGRGVFWRKVEQEFAVHYIGGDLDRPRTMHEELYLVVANDIDSELSNTHYDFRSLPEEWADRFDAVVLDPPYLYQGGIETLKDSIDRGYKNKERSRSGIHGVALVHQLYAAGMSEAYRVLRRKGILIVKCMDQVMSGKQVWMGWEMQRLAETLGFVSEDLFVLVNKSTPTMRHKVQDHARRNHSYFLVFKRRP